MITFKTGISKKEKQELVSLLSELTDIYGDFYITKNNLRLFIKENPEVLFDCLKKGDKIAYNENGIGIVTGFFDNAQRKYLKILAKNDKEIENIIKIVCWNIDCDLFVKIKKNNPLRQVFENNYFNFVGGRGREILLVRRRRKSVNSSKNKN